MQLNSFMTDIIASELEDAVGRENCSTREIDKLTHSVDYFWLSRMWADRGERCAEGRKRNIRGFENRKLL